MGGTMTLYEHFLDENRNLFRKEIANINKRLEVVGNDTGLMEEFFKVGAGKFGQNLCTFRDRPRSILRLFFIEYGNHAIVLGGGGVKPKTAKTTQDVPKLESEKNLLGQIADTLKKAERAGHFGVQEGGFFSTTNFIYDTNDYA